MRLQFPSSVQDYRLTQHPRFGAKTDKRGERPGADVEIPPADSVQFAEGSVDARLLASVSQASPQMAEILTQAHQRAAQAGATETGAAHLMLAIADSLRNSPHRSAGGRNPKQRDDRRFALALTKAIAPNEGHSPQELATVLESAVVRLWGEQAQAPNASNGVQGANPPLQLELRNVFRQALKKTHNDGHLAEALMRELKGQSGSNSPLVLASDLLKSLDGLTPQVDAEIAEVEESSSISASSSISSASIQEPELVDQVAEKAPYVAKWFKPTHYRPGDQVAFVPLPQAVAKGMDIGLRLTAPKKKGAGPKNGAENHVTALDAFIPGATESKLERAHAVTVLNNAQRKLNALPGPGGEDSLVEASEQSGKLLSRFIHESGREDYSPAAFMDFLRNLDDASVSPPEPLREVQRILGEVSEDAADQTARLQEQFNRECPTLLKYGQNLVKRGMNGQLPEVLMRREATDRMLAIINSGGARTSILLNAPSGEGKTYAVMGLAQRIANNDVPKALQNAQMVQLDLPALQSESTYKGEFERKSKEIFTQLSQYLSQHPRQKVIVFMDEMHLMAQDEGGMGLMDIMKASGILEKKNLTFIGATTPDDWRKSPLASDQSVLGRFHPVSLPGFTAEEKLAILGRQASQLEKQSGVEIPPEILEKVMRQASAKWPENSLRHAIDVLHLAASIAKGAPLELASLKDQLQRKELWLQTLSEKKTMKGRFQRQLEQTRQEAESLRAEIERHPGNRALDKPEKQSVEVVKEKHLRQALAVLTGEKIGTLTKDELSKLRNAQEIMSRHIVGQPEALAAIEEGLREIAIRHKTGAIRNRPIVSMLLPGPTGVGKTEAAKVIAKEFMKGNFIRLDMSDYMEKHSISRLTGAPPGYVGYDNGGLVDQIEKNPQSVVVFDEIEKAHPDIFNLLLQILEEGELRNNRGEPVSFRNAVIALTSNLNHQELTDLILRHRRGGENQDPQLAASRLEKEVRQLLTANPNTGKPGFRPEHLGRIDYVIPFSPLTGNNVSQILDIRLREVNEEAFFKDQNLRIALSDSARERLVDLTEPNKKAGDKSEAPLQGGARDVRSNFERYVYKRVMSELATDPELDELENAVITVDYDAGKQAFNLKVTPKPDFEPGAERVGKTLAFA